MTEVRDFPHDVREIEHVEVPMPDGCRLAARIWLPEGAEDAPVPAILEYIPYRKNDLTAGRDVGMHPYVAGHGYAVVRLDLRGAGDSEGLMRDEYLEQELADGRDAIAWIAEQPWCDGTVGMIGISWGGFNGLQVAALRPPALKAVITVCSTDDRYADDIHYMGGCMLIDQVSWASIMFARNTLPPDPRHRADWRDLWLERLRGSGLWLKNWLEHQTRDDFWKHGSICEDYSDVQVPVYAVGGWADGYCRTVFRLMQNLSVPRKGLVGPWAHKYPHIGEPGPAIGFLQEALRWWDHWLKGRDTGIMDEPMLRLWMQDGAPPHGHYAERPGRWVAEPSWPSPQVVREPLALSSDGRLVPVPEGGPPPPLPDAPVSHRSPLDVGMAGGKWCSYAQPGDQPTDQRPDDARSLVFETAPLPRPLEIAGDANLALTLEVDRPVAQVAARLVDVAPDGAATRVAWGVLNLTHRRGHEHPEPLEPGRRYTVRVPFKPVAQRFAAGHRIRLALSTSYFPLIWPAPEPVTMRVYPADCRLELPLRPDPGTDGRLAPFPPVERAPALETETVEPGMRFWRVIRDAGEETTTLEVADGEGTFRIPAIDLTIRKQGFERYAIGQDDPSGVRAETRWAIGLARGDWSIRTETDTVLTSDAERFQVRARLRAWEGESLVHEEEWNEAIPRHLA